jgi:hypothetical protein
MVSLASKTFQKTPTFPAGPATLTFGISVEDALVDPGGGLILAFPELALIGNIGAWVFVWVCAAAGAGAGEGASTAAAGGGVVPGAPGFLAPGGT